MGLDYLARRSCRSNFRLVSFVFFYEDGPASAGGTMKQFRRAIVLVWLIVSVGAGVTTAAPFFVPANKLYSVFPQCEARARGSACPACGLTTGFIAISDGRWDE